MDGCKGMREEDISDEINDKEDWWRVKTIYEDINISCTNIQ